MTELRFPLAAALALVAAAGSAAAQPKAISPGYWETTSQVLSPIHSTKVERRCIRPGDVAKFMQGPSNHIYNCTYPTRDVGPGSIRLKGSCASRDGAPFPIAGEGTFTADTFHFDAHASPKLGPLSIPVHATTDARRLAAECPAEASAASPAPAEPASTPTS